MVIGSSTVKASMDVKVQYYIHYQMDTMTNSVELVTRFPTGGMGGYIHTFRLQVSDEIVMQGGNLQYIVYGRWMYDLEKAVHEHVDNKYAEEMILAKATAQFASFSGQSIYTGDTLSDIGYKNGGFYNKYHDEDFQKKLYEQFTKPVQHGPRIELSMASRKLPGINSPTDYPCNCPRFKDVRDPVRDVIMHLNDKERWSREKIADWLDDLQDNQGYNFDFQPWAEEEELV